MTSFVKRHLYFILLCVAFAALSITLICLWFNSQLNPDATSYISIAQKYAAGDIRHAVNGYWGPLYSVLMVPGIWLGVDPIIAAKVVSVGAVLVILAVAYRFMVRREVARPIVYITVTALALFALRWVTYDPITPDVLLAMFIVLFAVRLVGFVQAPTLKGAVILGFVGAGMYFSKGFGLFLFIGVVGLVALWQWLRVDKNLVKVVRRYVPVAAVFLALVVPYIALISVKYHELTINNAGSYNHRMYGYYGMSKGNFPPVILKDGPALPVPPHNGTAVNSWEDPTYLIPLVRDWSLFDSADHFVFYVKGILGENVGAIANYAYSNGPLLTISVAVLALGWLQRKWYRLEFGLFGLIAALMVVGYALVFAEGRYFWAPVVLGTIGAALVAAQLYKHKVFGHRMLIAGGVLVCSLTAISAWQVIYNNRHTDQIWRDLSVKVKDVIPARSRIMSDTFDPTFRTCHYLQAQCSGVVVPPPDHLAYFLALKQSGIVYYINHHTQDHDARLTQFIDMYFTPVAASKVASERITIYKIKD